MHGEVEAQDDEEETAMRSIGQIWMGSLAFCAWARAVRASALVRQRTVDDMEERERMMLRGRWRAGSKEFEVPPDNGGGADEAVAE